MFISELFSKYLNIKMEIWGYVLISGIVIFLILLSFALFAGFVRQSLIDSNYSTNCTTGTTTQDLDVASSRVDYVFLISIILGIVLLLVSIVITVYKYKSVPAKTK
jgi:hypothetical protein